MVGKRTLAGLLGALSLALGEAFAAVDVVPEVTLFADTNDNTGLDVEAQEDESSRTGLAAEIAVNSFNERGGIGFTTRYVTDRYADPEDERYQSDDYYVLAAGRRNGQKVGVGFDLDYRNEGILNAELEDAIPTDPDADDPGEVDTGRLVVFNEQREWLRLTGDLSVAISERNVFDFQLQTQSVDYTRSDLLTALAGRSDYKDDRFAIGLTRRVDNVNRVSASLFVASYEAELNDNYTDSVGVEGRFTRPISQTWSLDVRAGVQRSDFNYFDFGTRRRIDNADVNYTFGTGVRKRVERGAVNLDLMHSVVPSSGGFLVVYDQLSSYYRHDLSPRFRMQLGARVSRSETLDDARPTDERDYATIGLGFEWAVSRVFFLQFGYELIRQEFVYEDSEDTTSHTLTVGFTYRGRSRRDQ